MTLTDRWAEQQAEKLVFTRQDKAHRLLDEIAEEIDGAPWTWSGAERLGEMIERLTELRDVLAEGVR